MKKRNFYQYLFLLTGILLLANCNKDKIPDVSGTYAGTTHRWQTWSDPVNGNGSSDTSYAETIVVTISDEDIITIGQHNFAVNEEHQYYAFDGTTASFYAGFSAGTDSLVIQSYNYSSSLPGTFQQTDTEFKGKKQ